MTLILQNRHHEHRVPVYASSFWSNDKQVYKDSLRRVEVVSADKNIATLRGHSIKYSWLKGASDTYKISPDIKDYIMCEIPSVTIDIPNRNLHCFTLQEAAYFDPRFGNFIYNTFVGKPVYADHDNRNPLQAKGIHFDAMLRKVPDWNVWKIYTLVGIDRTKDPVLASQIEKGQRRSWSMGAWVSYFISSITGQITNSNKAAQYPKGSIHNGILSYDIVSGIEFFEQSSVEGPADVTAESHQLWYF